MVHSSASRVPLEAAVTALRKELAQVWEKADGSHIRFHVAPIELTLEVAVTWTGTGSGGINWWLIDGNAKISRERVATQTIKIILEPFYFGEDGQAHSLLIDGSDAVTNDDVVSSSGHVTLDGADD